jgi:hypothetical protein
MTSPPRTKFQGLLRWAESAAAHPVVAYGAIVVLQTRVIWNVWSYKDLSPYDSAGYFLTSTSWADDLRDNIIWNPLYTSFWGTIYAAVGGVYASAMVHRIAIVLGASLLVLALMRSLLSPGVSLLLAAWWAVLPPSFNVYYEVHLYALLPLLAAALIAARGPRREYLGLALGTLFLSTLLLRNETLVAVIIFAIAIAIREIRERRVHSVPIRAYLLAYGLPLAIVCLLFAGAYWRSTIHGEPARSAFHAKHSLNVCQVYAFNYQQRHPQRFSGNPFTDCGPLMARTFGRPLPTFLQAVRANPSAVASFVSWNISLVPAGLQVGLFGATAGGKNPDYIPVADQSTYPIILSALVVAILLAGCVLLPRQWQFWKQTLAPRIWTLGVLASVAAMTVLVALTQRPRPEYIYPLTVALMALIGICATAVLRQFGAMRFVPITALAAVAVLCLAFPPYYHRAPRPLHDAVERLQSVRGSLQSRKSVLVTAADGQDICFYLAEDSQHYCTSPSWPALKAELDRHKPSSRAPELAGATAIYADATLRADPNFSRLITAPEAAGWHQIAAGTGDDGPWSVLVRAGQAGT